MEQSKSLNIEDELKKHKYYATNTVGTSMQPLFKTHRDMVIIKSAEDGIKKYDVVLYPHKHGNYILHRVIKIKGDICYIRGDNTFYLERVSVSDIIGVMVAFNRKGKRSDTDKFSYRLYSRIWVFIYPLRYALHGINIFVRKVYRRIFKRKET